MELSIGQKFAAAGLLVFVLTGLVYRLRPGWDSLDTAKSWSEGLGSAAILILALLVAAEILEHVYSGRVAELEKEKAASEQELAVASLSKAAAEIVALKKQNAGRVLTEEQRADIREFLSQRPKESVLIESQMGDGEGAAYAEQWATALREAGWAVELAVGVSLGRPMSGVQVHTPIGATAAAGTVAASEVPSAALSLLELVRRVHGTQELVNSHLRLQTVLEIGAKPP